MTEQHTEPTPSHPASQAAAPSPSPPQPLGRLGLLAAAGLPLVVYVLTLYPTVFEGDSADLETQAYTLGLAHQPGYATMGILGKVITTAVPVGSPGWRGHLIVAIAAAVATLCGYVLLRRWRVPAVAAVAAMWTLAFSPLFWSQAVQINSYMTNVGFAMAVVLLLDVWAERRGLGLLAIAMAVYGFGLGGYPSYALYTPVLGLFLVVELWREGKARVVQGLAVAAAAGVGGCLPWLAYTVYYVWHEQSPGTLSALVRRVMITLLAGEARSDWGVYATLAFWKGCIVRAVIHVLCTVAQFSPVGVLLAVAGALALLRRRRTLLLVGGAYAIQMLFAIIVRQWWHHYDVYRLPANAFLALFIGLGLGEVLRRVSVPWKRVALCAASTVLIVGPAYLVILVAPRGDQDIGGVANHLRPRAPFRYELARAGAVAGRGSLAKTPPGSTVWATWGLRCTLWFLQRVERCGEGVQLKSAGASNEESIKQIAESLGTGRVFYYLRHDQERRREWLRQNFVVQKMHRDEGFVLVELISVRRTPIPGRRVQRL